MMNPETMSTTKLSHRLKHLVTQERQLQMDLGSDPDAILGEAISLTDIAEEKRLIALELKRRDKQADQDRKAKIDQKVVERDEALSQVAELSAQLADKADDLQAFVDLYRDLIEASAKAYGCNEALKLSGESRMSLHRLSRDKHCESIRALVIQAFGVEPFLDIQLREKAIHWNFDFKQELLRLQHPPN
ncbi:hypothetical protein [Halomonas elongata]|uniref:Uncharacterized protein n=1 Tax=Halomonas elongata (strain ATCC 33173 / DSM 2581 / NBRC 15536 / NCIMB 2198 / 1H9) TaxID=768066 RepID=E1V7Y8_HALED|nr:hypothetical protein [Halomonas elongata]WBF18794.1 hypothetical protein LM502_03550 [Halomonas elongata]WPU47650.1 hypothetical protein SR933_01775 [Halomonas elongata DSM 2581]CBV41551.1 uncharacterized protein HELO_1667 [Halomonas elongata DSM 2581]